MNMLKITFDNSARDFVLDAFGKAVDRSDYIVEKNKPEQRVLTQNGQEIKKEKFAGVRKGSEVFVKSDLVSLIELCDHLKAKD